MKVAIVCFVKTPGISSFKTRLAKSIGKDLTSEFYHLSIEATKEIALSLDLGEHRHEFYWAVAEEKGMDSELWRDTKTVFQGTGNLADRLSKVYSELIQNHDVVLFCGADSPHIKKQYISELVSDYLSSDDDFLLAPAFDGGFYLFGGKKEISANQWGSVEYSTSKTCEQLKSVLSKLGSVSVGKKNFDIDTKENLFTLMDIKIEGLSPKQIRLVEWVKAVFVQV